VRRTVFVPGHSISSNVARHFRLNLLGDGLRDVLDPRIKVVP
jgi:ABC-type dipeptide/oligopeptide/nickel transport system permease subunit